ncbi:MAG: oxygen-independent coproporphyrinogen III oxidase [Alphaproteobacteria bacterium]|nr:oxygen-independent coproporphyrinogen III oxidase [Alphaproteobacteria bacterium]
MRPETLKRYAAPVPRYTSYPTAPHFSSRVGADQYGAWLKALPKDARLSLYMHIPYCDQLCWYCGCNTKATRRYEPIARYVDALEHEIDLVGAALKPGQEAEHIHFGGGSPNILSAEDIVRLGDRLKQLVRFGANVEYAVEVDPRIMPDDRIAAFAQAGVNRVSIGVQDFAPQVQLAINRVQSFQKTRAVIEGFRKHGVQSVNIDLVYGLPYQTRASVEKTIEQVVSLSPDRVALFGYAHLPQRLPHQRLIPEDQLPDIKERFAQSNRAANKLVEAGYVRVGLDHFAKPGDRLACGDVRRNFQGYTTDDAGILIGLGASAIGRLPQGYVQNAVSTQEYIRCVEAGELATARGHQMSTEDEMRSLAIERLMCGFHFPERELNRRFGQAACEVVEEARMLMDSDTDGLIEPDPDGDGFRVTEKGRLFVRSIASVFDSYLGTSQARHSAGV